MLKLWFLFLTPDVEIVFSPRKFPTREQNCFPVKASRGGKVPEDRPVQFRLARVSNAKEQQ